MIGIELSRPCGELVKEALKKGLLINVTSDKVVRLLPPLVIQTGRSGTSGKYLIRYREGVFEGLTRLASRET